MINTEKKTDYKFPVKVSNYEPGVHNSWGHRLLTALSVVETDYVLLTFDDFILEKHVSNLKIGQLIDVMKAHPEIASIYLVDTNVEPTSVSSFDDCIVELKDYSDYRLNSSPAIWRKADLIKYTGVNDNPWAWELFGSYRTFGDGKRFFSVKSGSPDIYPYNYSKGGAIYRGRWVKSVVTDKLAKYQLDIDTAERGFSEDAIDESRSLMWKLQFLYTGYKMVGFKSLRVFYSYFKAKFNARK